MTSFLNKLIFSLSILLLGSCGPRQPGAQEIVDQSNQAHNTSIFDHKKVSFDFRNKRYEVYRSGSEIVYTRSFQDSAGYVRDILMNSSDFQRTIEGQEVALTDEWKGRYGRSVNSVLYFFQLPKALDDPAVQKEYLGTVEIKGSTYHTIKITFRQEGGGEDFEDEFRYWINTESNLIDYLAYNYVTDGGGTRFREAINRRTVDGLVVQDYVNYKPEEKYPPMDSLPSLFESGNLSELSRIMNENIRVSDPD